LIAIGLRERAALFGIHSSVGRLARDQSSTIINFPDNTGGNGKCILAGSVAAAARDARGFRERGCCCFRELNVQSYNIIPGAYQ